MLLDHDFRREHLERSSNPPERPTDSRPTTFLLVYGKAFCYRLGLSEIQVAASATRAY